jgi:hypothetical protein
MKTDNYEPSKLLYMKQMKMKLIPAFGKRLKLIAIKAFWR